MSKNIEQIIEQAYRVCHANGEGEDADQVKKHLADPRYRALREQYGLPKELDDVVAMIAPA